MNEKFVPPTTCILTRLDIAYKNWSNPQFIREKTLVFFKKDNRGQNKMASSDKKIGSYFLMCLIE